MNTITGRPKKEFNTEQLEKLAELDPSLEEIAAFFDCSKSTVQRRLKEPEYSEALERGRQNGNISLKRKMWAKAMDGNTTMQIWLSKQRFGYADKQKVEQKAEAEQMRVLIYEKRLDGSRSEEPIAVAPSLSTDSEF